MENREKVLIIGGLGFIGKNLFIQLTKTGYKVDILSNKPLNNNDPFCANIKLENLIIGDIRDQNLLNNLVQDYKIIYSLAWFSADKKSLDKPIMDNQINCIGHINILEACRKFNQEVLIFFPSTRLVYGKTMYIPVDELHPLKPDSIYAVHKITAEYYYQLYYKLYGIRSIILRISNPYGPFQQMNNKNYSFLNLIILKALNKIEIAIFGEGKQVRDYIYIEDLIELLISLINRHELFCGSIYNVGSGKGISLIESVQIIKKSIPELIFTNKPWPPIYNQIETGDYVSCIKAIVDKTGWTPKTNFQEGIGKTIKFYNNLIKQYER